jgi:hypothetical protein
MERHARPLTAPITDAPTKRLNLGCGGHTVPGWVNVDIQSGLFTADYIEELLVRAGFQDVVECHYRWTSSRFPEIVELDNRERESLYVEATSP